MGKTNKALEAVDVNSVSHQGQQMTMQTAVGLWSGGRAKGAGSCCLLEAGPAAGPEGEAQRINAGCLEHLLPAALAESSVMCLLE